MRFFKYYILSRWALFPFMECLRGGELGQLRNDDSKSFHEKFVIPRGFGSKSVHFFAQVFSQKIQLLMERPWNGEAANLEKFVIPRGFGSKSVRFFAQVFSQKIQPLMEHPWNGEAANLYV
jgi:hypothetical protein